MSTSTTISSDTTRVVSILLPALPEPSAGNYRNLFLSNDIARAVPAITRQESCSHRPKRPLTSNRALHVSQSFVLLHGIAQEDVLQSRRVLYPCNAEPRSIPWPHLPLDALDLIADKYFPPSCTPNQQVMEESVKYPEWSCTHAANSCQT
jgi:hypothetical protein